MRREEAFSITELVRHLRLHLEQDELLSRVWVRGEISNFSRHRSGHMYFTLKDGESRIPAVMFAGNNRRLLFSPKNGDEVFARGYVSVYERGGQVQLYVQEMSQSGLGDLYTAYLALKERLEKEGLFTAPKKPLPFLPSRVGVVTSPNGAAIRDILTTIRRRSPIVHIQLHPVPVQGEMAPSAIAEAIDSFNQMGEVDVIIVGRGGGSLEELWAFNEEIVARSIYGSQIPVISAVGHETDFTIADFVSDLRAATPTAAAEMVAPDLLELGERVYKLKIRLQGALNKSLLQARKHLSSLEQRPIMRQPSSRLLKEHRQRLDLLHNSLTWGIKGVVDQQQRRWEKLQLQLMGQRPDSHIYAWREQLRQLERRFSAAIEKKCRSARMEWLRLTGQLDALSPLKVMQRGYALVYRYNEQQLIKTVEDVQPGDLLRIRLADGKLNCQVWGREALPDGEKK